MRDNAKLYLVVRGDLPRGAQAVQAAHALTDFFQEYPGIVQEWYTTSNHLCLLSVENEQRLQDLYDQALEGYVQAASFYEPDLNDELTAIALAPSEEARILVRDLRLALQD